MVNNTSYSILSHYDTDTCTLWNILQFPKHQILSTLSSFRQPHPVHSHPCSPLLACITSSQSSPSLSPSITPSVFHSRLKNSSLSQILFISHSFAQECCWNKPTSFPGFNAVWGNNHGSFVLLCFMLFAFLNCVLSVFFVLSCIFQHEPTLTHWIAQLCCFTIKNLLNSLNSQILTSSLSGSIWSAFMDCQSFGLN